MCGRMKSLPSADMIQQERFSHHREKEIRRQTNERGVERELQDRRQNREHHQHHEPYHSSHPPAENELALSSTAALARRQQRESADLYCESQSSADQKRPMLRLAREEQPQEKPRVEDYRERYRGEDPEGFRLGHRPLDSSSFF